MNTLGIRYLHGATGEVDAFDPTIGVGGIMRKFFLCITLLFVSSGCHSVSETHRTISPRVIPFRLPVVNENPQPFRDCRDLQNWRDRKWREWIQWNEGEDFLASRQAGAGAITLISAVAHEGPQHYSPLSPSDIVEPDRVQISSRYIYFVRKLSEGSVSLRYAIEIMDMDGLKKHEPIIVQSEIRPQLIVMNEELAVISQSRTGSKLEPVSRIDFFRWAEDSLLLRRTEILGGQYVDARLRNREIFLVTQSPIGGADFEISRLGLDCTKILEPALDDYSFLLTQLTRISFAESKGSSVGYLGRGDQVYMTAKNVYVFGHGYTWFPWDTRLISNAGFADSFVTKFSIESTRSRLEGTALVQGTTHDLFSFGESRDSKSLLVATSIPRLGKTTNRIWTLSKREGRFQTLAATEEFAVGEEIRSVRFVRDRAYVVTFRRTDPLFTFDVSKPLTVKMLGRIELPGFSSYLHPISCGNLFGAGYLANETGLLGGLQFSIFRPGLGGQMELKDHLEIGSRFSDLDVARDHRAFLYLSEKKLVATTVRIADTNGELSFAGALLLNLNGHLSVAGSLTHQDMIPLACTVKNPHSAARVWMQESFDVQRVLEVPRGIVTLSAFGAKLHRKDSPWGEIARLNFDPTYGREMRCLNTY